MTIQTESRKAFRELIDLLQEVDARWAGQEWNLSSQEDIAGAHRAIMHTLEAGLVGWFEFDPRNPDFRRIVTPSRKLTGDNADAWYFDAPVDARFEYVIHGNMTGAVYFALTIEENCADGSTATSTGGVINDSELEIDSNGNFTIHLGGKQRERNWLALSPSANRVTTRHYFENPDYAANKPELHPVLSIKCLNAEELPEPANDESIASGIRRVCTFLKSRTLDMPTGSISDDAPAFVSKIPNQLPRPCLPGKLGLSAADAHYAMAPYFLKPDEALVITGRWPSCRFANVCLWNRFMQIYDFNNRKVSINRAQMQADAEGNFKVILAHQNPGLPNWLDTEGKPFGLIYWRFFLVDGDVDELQTQVVKFEELTCASS